MAARSLHPARLMLGSIGLLLAAGSLLADPPSVKIKVKGENNKDFVTITKPASVNFAPGDALPRSGDLRYIVLVQKAMKASGTIPRLPNGRPPKEVSAPVVVTHLEFADAAREQQEGRAARPDLRDGELPVKIEVLILGGPNGEDVLATGVAFAAASCDKKDNHAACAAAGR